MLKVRPLATEFYIIQFYAVAEVEQNSIRTQGLTKEPFVKNRNVERFGSGVVSANQLKLRVE